MFGRLTQGCRNYGADDSQKVTAKPRRSTAAGTAGCELQQPTLSARGRHRLATSHLPNSNRRQRASATRRLLTCSRNTAIHARVVPGRLPGNAQSHQEEPIARLSPFTAHRWPLGAVEIASHSGTGCPLFVRRSGNRQRGWPQCRRRRRRDIRAKHNPGAEPAFDQPAQVTVVGRAGDPL